MRRLPPALLAALALAGCATATLSPAPATRTGSVEGGFAFSVPAPLDVRAWTPEYLSIGRPDGEGFASNAELRLLTPEAGDQAAGFEAFALGALRNLCAADGPGESVACGEAQQRQPFATASGLPGEVLYLARNHQGPAAGATPADAFGPIFLFDVSDRVPGPGPAALALTPPANLGPAEVDSALLRGIATSLAVEDPAR